MCSGASWCHVAIAATATSPTSTATIHGAYSRSAPGSSAGARRCRSARGIPDGEVATANPLPRRACRPGRLGQLSDARDLLGGPVRVDTLDLEQLVTRRGGDGLGVGVGGSETGLDALGDDALGLL